jgi:hypothetical protein
MRFYWPEDGEDQTALITNWLILAEFGAVIARWFGRAWREDGEDGRSF